VFVLGATDHEHAAVIAQAPSPTAYYSGGRPLTNPSVRTYSGYGDQVGAWWAVTAPHPGRRRSQAPLPHDSNGGQAGFDAIVPPGLWAMKN